MKDQMSGAHLITAGHHAQTPAAVLGSSFLSMAIEALARSYDHVIIDGGAVPETDGARFAHLAQTSVLVVTNPAHRQALAARQQLYAMGFADVTMLVVFGGAGV
jgi:Mrp family chromosome partitioning ATPase